MLMDMGDGMKLEVKQALDKSGRGSYGDEIMPVAKSQGRERSNTIDIEAKAKAGTHLLEKGLEATLWGRRPDWFNNDTNFSQAVQQALGLRQAVLAHADKFPLTAKTLNLTRWKPDVAREHRTMVQRKT